MYIPPDPFWYCTVSMMTLFSAFLCSTLFIMSMTFDRFYSVLKPHKAASFNTVKRAKTTILCIVVYSLLYNIPHIFISDNNNWECLPYGRAMGKSYGEFYYWLSFTVNFVLPFVLLLSMNSVIIHKIRVRPISANSTQNDHTGSKLQNYKPKTSESQTFAILLLVTFGFLILTTPAYMFFLCVMTINFFSSPQRFAGYFLFYNVGHKLQNTNHGINFFLYVKSGQKFRTDLAKLFKFNNNNNQQPYTSQSTDKCSVST